MSIDSTVDEFLAGGGVPSAKFPDPGTTVKGVVEAAVVTDQTDLDGNVRTWSDGNPRKQVVITLATDERDPEIADDDGRRKLYVKGQMTVALREALKSAGVKGLEVGGMLAVQYEKDGEPSKPGFNPPKIYKAQFKPAPKSAVSVDDLL